MKKSLEKCLALLLAGKDTYNPYWNSANYRAKLSDGGYCCYKYNCLRPPYLLWDINSLKSSERFFLVFNDSNRTKISGLLVFVDKST